MAAAARRGGTLKAALTGEPDMLDPTRSQIYTGAQVYDNIFSKLIDIDENQKFYGVLAKSWKQVDPKTWVFDLQSGVKFHNGEPFTAHDVKYTFERILNPKTASGYAPLYTAIKTVEVNSPTRVTFHLKTPFGPFLTNLANNGEIVNKRSIEAKGSARKPVGTGPFQFVEWEQGDHITLKKNPELLQEGPAVARRRAVPVPARRPGPHRRAALGRARLGRRGAAAAARDAAKDPQLTASQLEARGHPRLPRDERPQGAVRQPGAAPGDRLGARPRGDPQVAYFGAGEDGLLEVPTGSIWYSAADAPYPKQDSTKAKALMQQAGLSKRASRSATWGCRSTPSC